MKKIITIIVVMVLMVMGVAMADEARYYDRRDDVYFERIINDYNEAVENGEKIRGDMYLYEGIIYMTYSGLTYGRVGFGEFDRSKINDLETFIENAMQEAGIKHVSLSITFAGKDDFTNEDIYDIKLMTAENLNDFTGEKVGSGFIGEGITYYGMRVLGPISKD